MNQQIIQTQMDSVSIWSTQMIDVNYDKTARPRVAHGNEQQARAYAAAVSARAASKVNVLNYGAVVAEYLDGSPKKEQ